MSLRFVCYSIDVTEEFKSLSYEKKLMLVKSGNDFISDYMNTDSKCALICGKIRNNIFIMNLSRSAIQLDEDEYEEAINSECFKLLDIINVGMIEDGGDTFGDSSVSYVQKLLEGVEVPTDNKIKLLKAYHSIFGDVTSNRGIKTDYLTVIDSTDYYDGMED